MSMTFDQRNFNMLHAVERLAEIEDKRSAFIAQVRDMGSKLGMSTTDMNCFEDHLTDMESDLFFDEQRDLEYSAENAGEVADQSYADYSRAFWESPA